MKQSHRAQEGQNLFKIHVNTHNSIPSPGDLKNHEKEKKEESKRGKKKSCTIRESDPSYHILEAILRCGAENVPSSMGSLNLERVRIGRHGVAGYALTLPLN